MPCCCVPNCSERSEKGTRLFLLPQGEKNAERRKRWIINIEREGQLPNRSFVCEKHFTYDQFENNRMDKKRPLRWDAVPTIFSHRKEVSIPRKLHTSSQHTSGVSSEDVNTDEENANKVFPVEHSIFGNLQLRMQIP